MSDHILNPKEVEERKKKRGSRTQEAKPKQEKIEKSIERDEKFFNRGGLVQIHYESEGRFSIPETLYIKDYSIQHINDLALSKPQDILENLLAILDELINEDADCSTKNMTLEEFFETLVGMKQELNTTEHVHRWICECQENVPDSEQKIEEYILNLAELNYKSISDNDKDLQEMMLEHFKEMDDAEFKEYLLHRYKDNPLDDIDSWTREKEAETQRIKEPFYYIHPETGDIYGFKLTRIGDVVIGQKIAEREFKGKISQVERKPHPQGMSLAEFKSRQKQELESIQEEQAKRSIFYAKALTIVSFNEEIIEDDLEKIRIYKQLTRGNMFDLMDFLSYINFGIDHEIELKCSVCGKTEGRSLQQDLNPIELLPLDNDSKRRHKKSGNLKIYFAV